jgi:serine/threonine protein kinase/Rieske Fe-S protein
MQALSLDQLVGQILGNYRVERFLGNGRLNAVYLGRHLVSQRLDAVTMYLVPAHLSSDANTRFLTRFHKESAAITKLDHPHILPIYEYGEYLGTPYLVTPYVNKGSLADLLKRFGRYDHTAIVPLLEQVASGVAYAHSKGHIHGMLRPSNVVIRDQECLQVAGFGLMHMLQLGGIEKGEQPYAHLLTVGRTFLASPEYIAPEIVQGQAIDVRSDIYALGCILFELLCGQPPFTGSDPLEIARQHITQDLPSLRTLNPEVPIALVSVVNQALSRDPARRFQYVEELKEAFIQASRGASPNSMPKGHISEENWLVQDRVSEQLQAVLPDVYKMSNAGKWQLLPPIITSKLPALPLPSTLNSAATSDQQLDQSQPAAVTLPPIVPAQPPAVTASDSPVLAPDVNGTYLAEVSEASPLPALNSLPGIYEDTDKLAESYSWWSQPETVEGEKPLFSTREQQVPNAQPAQVPPTREPLVVPLSDSWTSESVAPGTFEQSAKKSRKSRKSKKRGRRRVVALLATGGVVAAGTAVVLNLNRVEALLGPTYQSLAARLNTQANNAALPPAPNKQANAPQPMPNKQANAPQPTPNTNTQNKKGTIIGNTQQKANSAVSFMNPVSDTPGILVRLADNTFVAYDKACTHVGVLVNYDPVTRMLVCPAHGSVFDPAKGGAVVKGPALMPLPKIGIQVQADGTVTTV